MLRKKVLVVLAAGMATRFGSLKQLNPVTPQGETLLDFSVYDALQAGFNAVVFIIKHSIAAEFEEKIAAHWRPHIEVRYAFQDNALLPCEMELDKERVKPLGTTHALYCAQECLHEDESFVVINADDYYGQAAYFSLAAFMNDVNRTIGKECGMVPYRLDKTLSAEGTVSRGVCVLDADNYLTQIEERTMIKRLSPAESGVLQAGADKESEQLGAGNLQSLPEEKIAYSEDNGTSWHELAATTPVSMNVWAFDYQIFTLCAEYLRNFLQHELAANPLKAECYLPNMVGEGLKRGELQVKALSGGDLWFGLTYKADQPQVESALAALKAQGVYPEHLF